MAPAGEMWSVVTESPTISSTRASRMSDGWPVASAEPVEVGRLADVGGGLLPGEGGAARHLEPFPELVALEDLAVLLPEELLLDVLAPPAPATSASLGQMSFRNTGRPWGSWPTGSAVRSLSTRPARAKATTSIGRHQEVGLDPLVDAGLEVAVAGEDGRDVQVVAGRWPPRSRAAGGRCCRCRSCSRRRPGETPAPPGRAAARPLSGSR